MFRTAQLTDFINPGGSKRYRVVGCVGDKEVKRNFKTKAQALRYLADIQSATPSQGTTEEVRAAVNLDILDRDALLAVLQRIVTEAKPLAPAAPTGPLVETAIKDFISAKTAKRLRPRSLSEYRSRLGFLRSVYTLSVSSVTREHLEPVIHRPGQASRTANGNRRVLFGFFEWCRKRKWCVANPVEEIEAAQVEDSEPKLFTVAEVREILRAGKKIKRGATLPYLVLGFFAGLRPMELSRLQWGTHILPRQGIIRVTGDIAKKRAKRTVEIHPTLAAWLKLCDGKPVRGKNFVRRLDAVRRAAGFKPGTVRKKDRGLKEWPFDGLRHTALSMKYADTQNETATAYWAGNSPDVFHTHYKGLVTAPEAAKFWALLPEVVLAP